MTKMPDKIYLTRESDQPNDIKVWGVQVFNSTEYTRSDLIPQPVTDEAREKALALIEDYAKNNKRNLKIATPVMVKDLEERALIYDTIKSALSQPANFLKSPPTTNQLKENAPQLNQPEAIQKAVRGLELAHKLCNRCTSEVCDDTTAIDIDIGLKALRTHQSELEALNGTLDSANETNRVMGKRLKELEAENADLSIHLDGCRGVLAETEERERALIAEHDDLRRAVVDLYDGLMIYSNEGAVDVQEKHAAAIAKAKAVQDA